MSGGRLTSVEIGKGGIAGNRIWCIADADTGQPAAPKKEVPWRPILLLHSRLRSCMPEIGFPDEAWLQADSGYLDDKVSRHFGFDASARPYGKAK
jgi:uncharacterized protein YcbX